MAQIASSQWPLAFFLKKLSNNTMFLTCGIRILLHAIKLWIPPNPKQEQDKALKPTCCNIYNHLSWYTKWQYNNMAINLLGLKVEQLNYYHHSCMYLIYIIRIVFTTIWKVIGLCNDKKDYLKTLLSPSQFLLNISIVHQDKVTLCFHM